MDPLFITIAAFLGVAALVGAVAVMVRDRSANKVEDRLDVMTGTGATSGKKKDKKPNLLTEPLDAGPGIFASIVERFSKFALLFQQADTNITPAMFFGVSGLLAAGGWMMAWILRSPAGFLPLAAVVMGLMPLCWLMMRRKRRLKYFATQLPDALELIGRALRAGHSLQAGFQLVSTEMPPPVGKEFGYVFEEQNLGISMEEALYSMCDRVPNLDLKFFATAVILQRQTGGDLAEILDKIGNLIRQRFQIWGQVQALTGEGRLSGIVLLALPPLLFLAVYKLNPDYIMVLFSDPMGKQMLAGAIVMQVLGALVIRKIVNIKV